MQHSSPLTVWQHRNIPPCFSSWVQPPSERLLCTMSTIWTCSKNCLSELKLPACSVFFTIFLAAWVFLLLCCFKPKVWVCDFVYFFPLCNHPYCILLQLESHNFLWQNFTLKVNLSRINQLQLFWVCCSIKVSIWLCLQNIIKLVTENLCIFVR